MAKDAWAIARWMYNKLIPRASIVHKVQEVGESTVVIFQNEILNTVSVDPVRLLFQFHLKATDWSKESLEQKM